MNGPLHFRLRTRRLAGPLSLVIAIAALGGCAATPQTRALLDERPSGLPARAELERVPFFPQERYQCGPAALATVLTDLGENTTPEALVDEVYVPERRGTLRTEMRAATRARGLVPYPLRPELDDLLQELAAGRPVLVMQNLGLDWLPQWHFAVAVGYDLDKRLIILRSGTQRRRVTVLSTFERTWMRADRWAQVVVPPDEPPATAEPLRWLQAVHELEQSPGMATALPGYRAATERWPDSVEAWMARGNAAYATDAMNEARQAFTSAVELDPDRSEGWNNLAYALTATNCANAAREAAQCAVTLAPDDPGPRDTLKEIRSMAGTTGLGQCEIPACPGED